MPGLRCWTIGQKKHHSHCIPITQAYTCYSLRKELREYKPGNPPVKLMNMSGFPLVKAKLGILIKKLFSQTNLSKEKVKEANL